MKRRTVYAGCKEDPRLLFRNHRQFCGLPGGQAAGHLDQIGDPILVQDAGRDGRAVAARAMHGDAAIARGLSDARADF